MTKIQIIANYSQITHDLALFVESRNLLHRIYADSTIISKGTYDFFEKCVARLCMVEEPKIYRFDIAVDDVILTFYGCPFRVFGLTIFGESLPHHAQFLKLHQDTVQYEFPKPK